MPRKLNDRWERLEKRIGELAAEHKAWEGEKRQEKLSATASAAEAKAIRDGTIVPVLENAARLFEAGGLPANVTKDAPVIGFSAPGPNARLEVTLAGGSWVLIFRADPTTRKVEASRSIEAATQIDPATQTAPAVQVNLTTKAKAWPYEFSEVTREVVQSAVEVFATEITSKQGQNSVRPRAQVRGALR